MENSKFKLNHVLASTGTQGQSRAPLTIMLVDNDEDCRTFMREAIRECDGSHRCVECGEGQAALDYLAQTDADSRPGLIFLDVEMPGLDGLTTLERIKADPRFADIPVVMLTGVADESYMRRAAALGANSYTVKPAGAEQFLSTVQTSTAYWLTVHQYPHHHVAQSEARR